MLNSNINIGVSATAHKAVKRPLFKSVDSTLRKDLFGNQVLQSNPYQRFMASQASAQVRAGSGVNGPYGAAGFSHIFQHLSNMVTGEMFGNNAAGKKLLPIIEPGGALRIGSSTYGPSNLLDLRDRRARELQSFAFLTRNHLRMIERYKKREEEVKNDPLPEAAKTIAEKKAIQTQALANLESVYQRTKLSSYEHKVVMVQKHWRAFMDRQSFKAKKAPKATVLWRVNRALSVYKSDKWLREIHLVVVLLAADEAHVEIKTKPIDNKHKANWCLLKIAVKELVEYFDIGKDELISGNKLKFEEVANFGFANLKDGAFYKKREERVENIRSFTSCFLDSLLIENQQLKFNQRKKLQKLIELLNDDSVLYMSDPEGDSADDKKDDLSNSVLSSAGLALKKNNYEQYLDMITTRVQKRVKGFLARKRFQSIRDIESVKFFEAEINQDGEDLYIVLMKRVKTGFFTAFAYNFSTNKFFNQLIIRDLPERAVTLTEPREVGQAILERILFDLDRDMMYYHDFYMSSPDIEDISNSPGFQEQKTKVDRFMELYRIRHKNNFKKKGFALESRYSMQGKKFMVYKGVPLNVAFFISTGGKTIRLDVLRMDVRQFTFMKVYACLGEYMSHVAEGNRLYEALTLEGELETVFQDGTNLGSTSCTKCTLDITYESKLLEKIESDFGSRQFELIRTIQRHFKTTKLKESFWACFGNKQFLIEVYFLAVTERILIKALDSPEEEVTDQVSQNKIYSSMKMKNSDEISKDKKLQLSQMIVLSFQDLHLPLRENAGSSSYDNPTLALPSKPNKQLTIIANLKALNEAPNPALQPLMSEDQIIELIRYLVFKKLRYEDGIRVDPISPEETKELLSLKYFKVEPKKPLWDPPKFQKMDSHNQSLEDLNLHIELDSQINQSVGKGYRAGLDKSKEATQSVELLPTLKWDFNIENNEVVLPPDGDMDEPLSPPPDSTEQINPKAFQSVLARTKFADKVAKAYNTFMKHKTMKPKLFAVHSFNSLRKNQKRLTIPVVNGNDDHSAYESNRSRGNKENPQRRSSVGHSATQNEEQQQDVEEELEMKLLGPSRQRSSRVITIPEQPEGHFLRRKKRTNTLKDSNVPQGGNPPTGNSVRNPESSIDPSNKPDFRIKESPLLVSTRMSAKLIDHPKQYTGNKLIDPPLRLPLEPSLGMDDEPSQAKIPQSKRTNVPVLRLPTDSMHDSQRSMSKPHHFRINPQRSGSGIASESVLNLETPEARHKEARFDERIVAPADPPNSRPIFATSKPRKSSIRIKTDKMSIEGYDVNTPRDSQASKFRIPPTTSQPPKNPPPSPDKPRKRDSGPAESADQQRVKDSRPGAFNFFTQLKPARTISSNSELG